MHCSSCAIHFHTLFSTDAQAVLWTWDGCFLLWSKERQTERNQRTVRNLLVIVQAFHNFLLRPYKCFSEVNGRDLSDTFHLFCSVYCSESLCFFSEQKWLEEKKQALMAANDHVERLQMEKENLSELGWVRWQSLWCISTGGQQSMWRVTEMSN